MSEPVYKAETNWFHFFRSMIDSGDLTKMEGSTVKVYLVMKAHANFANGYCIPSQETIAEKSGYSVTTVKRCQIELVDMGYLVISKEGRSNSYTFREKVLCHHKDGEPPVLATWNYLPRSVKNIQDELKKFLLTGVQSGSQVIQFTRLTTDVQDHSLPDEIPTDLDELLKKVPPDLRDKLQSALQKAKNRKKG